MRFLVAAIVIATSIWTFLDAKRLGVAKAGESVRTGRVAVDTGSMGWLACCLLFWIVAFPFYLSSGRAACGAWFGRIQCQRAAGRARFRLPRMMRPANHRGMMLSS